MVFNETLPCEAEVFYISSVKYVHFQIFIDEHKADVPTKQQLMIALSCVAFITAMAFHQ